MAIQRPSSAPTTFIGGSEPGEHSTLSSLVDQGTQPLVALPEQPNPPFHGAGTCQARTRLGIPAAPRLLAWAGINPILGPQLACTDGERRQRHPQNQLPAVQSATWQTERPATHTAARAGEGVPPVCSTGSAGAQANGGARGGGQGTGHLHAVGSLISSVRQNPFLSSLFSTSFPCPVCPVSVSLLIPYYPLPTTHTRCEGPIDHLPTTRLDVAAVKWSNPSIQPRLANPTTDTDSPPATAKPPTLD